MIEVTSNTLLCHRGYKKEVLLFSSLQSDNECKMIEEHLKKLSLRFRNILILKIDWNDLCSKFLIPPSITSYTVFYMMSYQGIGVVNIGIIDKPNSNQLKNFYLRCNEVSKSNSFKKFLYRNMGSRRSCLLSNNFITDQLNDTNSSTFVDLETNEPLKMKIYSEDCYVYQFKRKFKKSI